MKIAPIAGFLVVFGVFQLGSSLPVAGEGKETKGTSVYVLGSLYNAAVSNGFSKSQASNDRHESEWNNSELYNNIKKSKVDKSKHLHEEARPAGRVLIYAGGDASNVAIAYQASEAQAAENDQKSGYNSQNLALSTGAQEYEYEYDEEDEAKKKAVSSKS